MDKQILVSQLQTPDGTILCSRNRHDYVTHRDKNGKEYMLDGGTDYIRCSANGDEVLLTLYVGDDFSLIREKFVRGGRGKDGDQPLKFVPLKDMSDKWLLNTINYILRHVHFKPLDRIDSWVDHSDSHFKMVRVIMPSVIHSHLKVNKIDSVFLTEVYIKELEYRIEHQIYVPDEEDIEEQAEKARVGLWRTLLNLVGL